VAGQYLPARAITDSRFLLCEAYYPASLLCLDYEAFASSGSRLTGEHHIVLKRQKYSIGSLR